MASYATTFNLAFILYLQIISYIVLKVVHKSFRDFFGKLLLSYSIQDSNKILAGVKIYCSSHVPLMFMV